jgi:hypothetical protein
MNTMSSQPTSSQEDELPTRRSRRRSDSQPSTSAASTDTIDSTQKVSHLESLLIHDTWSTETQKQLLNIEELKEQQAQAKHWRTLKHDLKTLVSRLRNEAVSRKFELEVKAIGPLNVGQECIPG